MEDYFTDEQPAAQASAMVAAPVAYVMNNDFERVSVEKIDVEVSSSRPTRADDAAGLDGAPGPCAPGPPSPRVLLRTYRGETHTETIPVAVPASARRHLIPCWWPMPPRSRPWSSASCSPSSCPRILDQLIRAINGLRRNNHVYARLMRA